MKIFQILLSVASAACIVLGVVTMTHAAGNASSVAGAYIVFGFFFLIIGALAAIATFSAKKWFGWLFVAPVILCLGLPIGLVGAFWIDMEKGEVHRRALEEEMRSGRYDFGNQPALLAVAQAIRANNQDAIRVAAKKVPDLQTADREGTTLLCWAIRQSWQRPELVEAVRTLLSLGVDPNYTNGHRESFAMANAVHGSAPLLRSMLEAGGNPNTRDEFGRPIILMNWYLGYYSKDQRARLDLLLDHGADIDSTMPETESEEAGYTLLLYRTEMGPRYSDAYADVMHLLERGADPNRTAPNGMDLAKMLTEHRKQFAGRAPPEFSVLWEWAVAHGVIK